MSEMLVRELMTIDPVSVRADATIKEALALLDEHDITAVPVVTPRGVIIGVVSEADLIRDQVRPDPWTVQVSGADEGTTPSRIVAEVMSPHAVTVRPETDLATAVDLTTSTGIKSIPVVDEDDHVIGVISRRDIVHLLAKSDEELESEVDAFLVSTGRGDWLVDVHDGIVELTGPTDTSAQTIAMILARSVPGVLEVRVS